MTMYDALPIMEYLPLSFKTRGEQEYFAFLWDAFETNYTHGKYQFAILACHIDGLCLFQYLADLSDARAGGLREVWPGGRFFIADNQAKKAGWTRP